MEVEEARNCAQTFIDTQFEAGRHKQRIEKI
jgi:ribose 5-phosphate isomerase RpiB